MKKQVTVNVTAAITLMLEEDNLNEKNTMAQNMQHDVDIIDVSDLEPEFAENITKPWAIQYADGSVVEFDTEEGACTAQQIHRFKIGLDPMTGEKIK